MSSSRSRLGLLIGILVSVVAAVFAVRSVDPGEVVAQVGGLDLRWLGLAAVLHLLRLSALLDRWYRLLRSGGEVSLRFSLASLAVGYGANATLPARAGDALRAVGTARQLGRGVGAITGLLVVERLADLAVLLLLAVVFVPTSVPARSVLDRLTADIGSASWVPFLASGLAGLVVILLLLRLPFLAGGRALLARFIGDARDAVRRAAAGGVLGPVVAGSLITWGLELLTYAAVLRAGGLELPWMALLTVGVLGSLVTMVPSAPGAVGTFELGVQLVLQGYGVDPSQGLGLAIVIHLLVLAPISLLGLLHLPGWSRAMADGSRAG